MIGFLTILGYSLYDTVVVFDKVRENTSEALGNGRLTYQQAANLAVNQTLVRSINTTIVALLPIASILVIGFVYLGPGTLLDLALALFVGIAVGAYSSIFIATPVLVEWKERETTYMRRRRLMLQQFGGHIPAFAPGTLGEPVPAAAAAGAAAGAGAGAGVAAAAATPEPEAPAPTTRAGRRQRREAAARSRTTTQTATRPQRPRPAPPAPGDGAPRGGDGAPPPGDGAPRDGTPPSQPPERSAQPSAETPASSSAPAAPSEPPAKPRQKQKPKRQKRRKHGRR